HTCMHHSSQPSLHPSIPLEWSVSGMYSPSAAKVRESQSTSALILAAVTCAQRHIPAPPKGQAASLRVTNRPLLLVICGPKSGEQVTLGCRSQALHGFVALSHENLKIALPQTAK